MRIHIPENMFPGSLAGPIRVDAYGLPRYWLTVWDVLDAAGVAPSTRRKQQAAIERFYLAVERRLGVDCLDRLLTDADLERLASTLEGFFVELRNRGLEKGISTNGTWQVVYDFVRTTLERILQTSDIPRMNALHAHLTKLDNLYTQISPVPESGTKKLRALPSVVIEDLEELLRPGSSRNPFRSADNGYRNYALYKLLLHQGLRRGESAILAIDCIKDGIDPRSGQIRFWINVAENPHERYDPRHDPPSMKTPSSTRQIPIAEELANLVEFYAENYRGHQDHSFLFASQKKSPLSLPMINRIFDVLSERLSKGAKIALKELRGKEKVTPHDCRHTCAVFRLTEFIDAGETMDVALGKLRAFFGWTVDSEMPRHYARAYFEDRLTTIWDGRFDAHIDLLRSLECEVD